MEFKEALAKLYRQSPQGNVFRDPMLLYAALSDLCGADFHAKERIELFYSIDKRLHVFSSVCNSDGDINPLLARYGQVSELLSAGAFRALALLVAEIISKKGECFYPQITQPAAGGNNKPVPAKPNAPKAQVKSPAKQKPKANAPAAVNANNQFATPVVAQPTNTSSYHNKRRILSRLSIAAIILGIVTGIVLLIVFRNRIAWWQWQHIIGAFGGLIGTSIVLMALYIIGEAHCCDEIVYKVTPILFVVLSVVSTIMACVFPAAYRIMYYYLQGYMLLGIIISALVAYSDVEDEWTWFNVCAALAMVGEIIIVSLQNWSQMQHIIGCFGGLTVACIVGGILYYLYDSSTFEEWYKPTIILSALAIICNLVLGFVLGVDYRVMFYWFGGWLIATSAVGFYGAYDDVEDGWMIVAIIETLVAAGSIVLVRYLA